MKVNELTSEQIEQLKVVYKRLTKLQKQNNEMLVELKSMVINNG